MTASIAEMKTQTRAFARQLTRQIRSWHRQVRKWLESQKPTVWKKAK